MGCKKVYLFYSIVQWESVSDVSSGPIDLKSANMQKHRRIGRFHVNLDLAVYMCILLIPISRWIRCVISLQVQLI